MHKGSSSNSFEKFRKDIFNDSLCDPLFQGCKGGSKLVKNIKIQIKNLGTLEWDTLNICYNQAPQTWEARGFTIMKHSKHDRQENSR